MDYTETINRLQKALIGVNLDDREAVGKTVAPYNPSMAQVEYVILRMKSI